MSAIPALATKFVSIADVSDYKHRATSVGTGSTEQVSYNDWKNFDAVTRYAFISLTRVVEIKNVLSSTTNVNVLHRLPRNGVFRNIPRIRALVLVSLFALYFYTNLHN